jgi:putative alpha-1,2-mannosidase
MSTVISNVGGDEAFVSRLDFLHTSGLADISNEPGLQAIFLYHYAGRPVLSTRRMHTYLPRFNSAESGLPGNDDSGAMGSFVVFCALGLFPVAGQNVYLISAPLFKETSIRNKATGKTATVKSLNFDPLGQNIYIQNVTVNGKPWTKSWVSHEFFTEGWTIEIMVGASEGSWGTSTEDRPPSWTNGMRQS